MALGHGRRYSNEAHFDRFGRKAIKRDRSQNFCLWLQAEDPRTANFVGFASSFGHSDAEFPLLDALRTKPGVPRPAAIDPKET